MVKEQFVEVKCKELMIAVELRLKSSTSGNVLALTLYFPTHKRMHRDFVQNYNIDFANELSDISRHVNIFCFTPLIYYRKLLFRKTIF